MLGHISENMLELYKPAWKTSHCGMEITFSMLIHVGFWSYFVKVNGIAWLFPISNGDSGFRVPEVGVQVHKGDLTMVIRFYISVT